MSMNNGVCCGSHTNATPIACMHIVTHIHTYSFDKLTIKPLDQELRDEQPPETVFLLVYLTGMLLIMPCVILACLSTKHKALNVCCLTALVLLMQTSCARPHAQSSDRIRPHESVVLTPLFCNGAVVCLEFIASRIK